MVKIQINKTKEVTEILTIKSFKSIILMQF